MGSAVDGHGGHGHGHGHDHDQDHDYDHDHGPIRGQQVGVVEGAAHPLLLQQVGVGVRVGVLQQVEVEVPPLALQVEVGVTHPSANRIAMYDGKIKH